MVCGGMWNHTIFMRRKIPRPHLDRSLRCRHPEFFGSRRNGSKNWWQRWKCRLILRRSNGGYRIEDQRPVPVNGLCSFTAVREIAASDPVDELVAHALNGKHSLCGQ